VKQIPPLRCGMTNKKDGMTNKNARSKCKNEIQRFWLRQNDEQETRNKNKQNKMRGSFVSARLAQDDSS
jgi:hypothetical protein